jgi:hypothetical protein
MAPENDDGIDAILLPLISESLGAGEVIKTVREAGARG